VRNEPQQQQQQQQQVDDSRHCQTVGAVAIDSAGRLAAATSTGGRTNKVSRHDDGPGLGQLTVRT
jgi:beta-aspartyl-peptidase (threonine type)